MKYFDEPKLLQTTIIRSVIVVLVFTIIIIKLFTNIDTVPFHGDEVNWATSGYYYYQLMFIDHDVSLSKWNRRDLKEWGLLSLPVGKYFIGMAMHFTLPPHDYNYFYDFSTSEEENRKRGNIPPLEILRPARIMSAIASTVACVVIFWICSLVWNWIVGSLSALLLSYNSLFHLFAQRAMTDSYLILFLVISILCCVYLTKIQTSSYKLFGYSVLLGIVCGICGSVKLNGFVSIVCGTFTLCLLAGATKPRRWENLKKFVLAEFLMVVFAVGSFIALNPLFYSSSPSEIINRFSQLLEAWNKLIQFQQRMFPTQAIIGFPSTALVHLFSEYLTPVVTIASLFGIILTIKKTIDGGFKKNFPLVVYFSVSVIIITTIYKWIPLNWDRYYLPIVVASIPFAGYALFILIDLLLRRFRLWTKLSQTMFVRST